eukprot:Nk52_evm12s77 gene=Nk52_evmTU12s77
MGKGNRNRRKFVSDVQSEGYLKAKSNRIPSIKPVALDKISEKDPERALEINEKLQRATERKKEEKKQKEEEELVLSSKEKMPQMANLFSSPGRGGTAADAYEFEDQDHNIEGRDHLKGSSVNTDFDTSMYEVSAASSSSTSGMRPRPMSNGARMVEAVTKRSAKLVNRQALAMERVPSASSVRPVASSSYSMRNRRNSKEAQKQKETIEAFKRKREEALSWKNSIGKARKGGEIAKENVVIDLLSEEDEDGSPPDMGVGNDGNNGGARGADHESSGSGWKTNAGIGCPRALSSSNSDAGSAKSGEKIAYKKTKLSGAMKTRSGETPVTRNLRQRTGIVSYSEDRDDFEDDSEFDKKSRVSLNPASVLFEEFPVSKKSQDLQVFMTVCKPEQKIIITTKCDREKAEALLPWEGIEAFKSVEVTFGLSQVHFIMFLLTGKAFANIVSDLPESWFIPSSHEKLTPRRSSSGGYVANKCTITLVFDMKCPLEKEKADVLIKNFKVKEVASWNPSMSLIQVKCYKPYLEQVFKSEDHQQPATNVAFCAIGTNTIGVDGWMKLKEGRFEFTFGDKENPDALFSFPIMNIKRIKTLHGEHSKKIGGKNKFIVQFEIEDCNRYFSFLRDTISDIDRCDHLQFLTLVFDHHASLMPSATRYFMYTLLKKASKLAEQSDGQKQWSIDKETPGILTNMKMMLNGKKRREPFIRERRGYSYFPSDGISGSSTRQTQRVLESRHANPPRSSRRTRRRIEEQVEEKIVLVYKPHPEGASITISTIDLERLRNEEEYLNDTIIEFYLMYLLYERCTEEQRKKVHIFNSFFYKKYTDNLGGNSEANRQNAYEKVHKWTRKVDLFEKEMIIVPINQTYHWLMGVIFYPKMAVNNEQQESRELVEVSVDKMPEVSEKSGDDRPTTVVTSEDCSGLSLMEIDKKMEQENSSSEKPEDTETNVSEEVPLPEEYSVRSEEDGTKIYFNRKTRVSSYSDPRLSRADTVDPNTAKSSPTTVNAPVVVGRKVYMYDNSVPHVLGRGLVESENEIAKEESDVEVGERGSPSLLTSKGKTESEEILKSERKRQKMECIDLVEPHATVDVTNVEEDHKVTSGRSSVASNSRGLTPVEENVKPVKDSASATPGPDAVPRKPCIIIFDSLGGHSNMVFRNLRSYLTSEYARRHKEEFEFTSKVVPGHHAKAPLQSNSHDCGVFLVHYVEQLLLDRPITDFSAPISLLQWFGKHRIRKKRMQMLKIIERKVEEKERKEKAENEKKIEEAKRALAAKEKEDKKDGNNSEVDSSKEGSSPSEQKRL